MKLFGAELNTPEEVAAWLGTEGTGLPPNYDGPADALREDADDFALATAGAVLAMERGTPKARSEGIRALRNVGGPMVSASVARILASRPSWWRERDPRRGGTLGEQFLSMATFGESPRRSPAEMLDASRGTAVEDEVMFSVLAWAPEGVGLDRLIARLGAGEIWPASRWKFVVRDGARTARLGELIPAVARKHGVDVRDEIIGVAPGAAVFWPMG